MKYIVIGLGNFGAQLAVELTELGHEVIGIDIKNNKINELSTRITSAYQLDATDIEALKILPFPSVDAVFVAIGKDLGISIEVVAKLRHLHVSCIYARAFSDTHKIILESLHVEQIFTPEISAAKQIAHAIEFGRSIISMDTGNKHCIIKFPIPSLFIGYTINEINIEKEFAVQIISISQRVASKNIFNKTSFQYVAIESDKLPQYKLQEDDLIIIFGCKENIRKMLKSI